jgi:prepilin-type N-terminal cleavage/methylation domain-containing protein
MKRDVELTGVGLGRLIRTRSGARGFTLIEFILVMALLATLMALAAPSLSRSLRQRTLEQEGLRLLAVTEHGRNEAISRGVPMVIWIEGGAGRFGLGPKAGYPRGHVESREYVLSSDVRFDLKRLPAAAGRDWEAIEFGPDGTLALSSVASVRLVDRRETGLVLARTTNGWGYEILRDYDDVRMRR